MAVRYATWVDRQAALAAKKEETLAVLSAQSEQWVTEETLERHVEDAVDAFFISTPQALRAGGDESVATTASS